MKCRPRYNQSKACWECKICEKVMRSVAEERNCSGSPIESLFGGLFKNKVK